MREGSRHARLFGVLTEAWIGDPSHARNAGDCGIVASYACGRVAWLYLRRHGAPDGSGRRPAVTWK